MIQAVGDVRRLWQRQGTKLVVIVIGLVTVGLVAILGLRFSSIVQNASPRGVGDCISDATGGGSVVACYQPNAGETRALPKNGDCSETVTGIPDLRLVRSSDERFWCVQLSPTPPTP